jgi:hypothetical protein
MEICNSKMWASIIAYCGLLDLTYYLPIGGTNNIVCHPALHHNPVNLQSKAAVVN